MRRRIKLAVLFAAAFALAVSTESAHADISCPGVLDVETDRETVVSFVLRAGGPGCPCHSAGEPWHLTPIVSELAGQVKPEP